MSQQVLHLMDPGGRLRIASDTIRSTDTVEHGSLGELAEVFRSCSRPATVVADVSQCDGSQCEVPSPASFAANAASPLHLLLVVTADASSGAEWLRGGAFDVLPLSRVDEELDARLERLLRWSRDLVEPGFQEARFRASISRLTHALKNPLNCVFGYLQLLQPEPDLPPRCREDISRALENTEELIRIIERTTRDVSAETRGVPADIP